MIWELVSRWLREIWNLEAGNLLGSEQSGHIASVGLELYTQMIDRAVRRIEQAALVSLEEMKVQISFWRKKS